MPAVNRGIEYIVLDSVAASGGDVDLDAGIITVGNSTVGELKIPHKRILVPNGWTKQVKVAETAQVDTLTPTAANSTEYKVTIRQEVGGEMKTFPYKVNSDASATATEICNNFRTQIAADPRIKVTGSGTTTLILTADTGYPIFHTTASSNISIANTTPGVAAKNTGALLDADGYDVTSSNNYTSYVITYEDVVPTAGSQNFLSQRKTVAVFLNEGDGDAGDFITEMDNIGLASTGAAADSDSVAVV